MVVKKQLKTIPTTFLSSISWILNVVIYSKAIVRQDFGGIDRFFFNIGVFIVTRKGLFNRK
jgi:hypothetical protein